MIQRYFYNATANSCQSFRYGGCAGNQNNFRTERDCLQRCRTEGEEASVPSAFKRPPKWVKKTLHNFSTQVVFPHPEWCQEYDPFAHKYSKLLLILCFCNLKSTFHSWLSARKPFLECGRCCFCWVEAQQLYAGVKFWFHQTHKQQFSVSVIHHRSIFPHLWLAKGSHPTFSRLSGRKV